jgi:uncharacterized protein YjbI with pentapeptide repeats
LKTTNYTDDLLGPKQLETIKRLLNLEDTNFVDQVRFCGLDPATDFQNLDLSDVNFSNCDLRGFNFSGADLRGSFGVNVIWEVDDPIFKGAEIADSLFSYRLSDEQDFRDTGWSPDDTAW